MVNVLEHMKVINDYYTKRMVLIVSNEVVAKEHINLIRGLYTNIPCEYRDAETIRKYVYDSLHPEIKTILNCYLLNRKEQDRGIYPDTVKGIRMDARWDFAQLDSCLTERDVEFLLDLADEVGGYK